MAAVGLCNLMAQERSSVVPLLSRGARPKFWIYCPKPRATPRRRRFRTTVTPTRSSCAVYGPRQAASPNCCLSGRRDGYGRGLEAATRGPNPARPGSVGARRVVGPEVARVRTRRRSPRATGRRSCAHRRSVRRSCAHALSVTGFHRAATMDNKAWTQGYERVDDALVNARSVPRHVWRARLDGARFSDSRLFASRFVTARPESAFGCSWRNRREASCAGPSTTTSWESTGPTRRKSASRASASTKFWTHTSDSAAESTRA
mmetsp:Transcript_17859/g.54397  ORF Transcript_17859/g.54397 Transcript_17859/m.54397 type:complete len:261 (+) Transcript_17859:900-1682(+)